MVNCYDDFLQENNANKKFGKVKVTMYFQGWFQLTCHSASRFHYRYSKPYIKLKLIKLTTRIC